MRRLSLLAACGLSWTLFSALSMGADLAQPLAALRAVGPQGAGHLAAAQAWAVAARAEVADLPTLLTALDGANPLASNWIRTAIDAAAERTAQLPVADLEKFLRDVRHAPRARRLAYELLVQSDAGAAERFLPGMLDDPSLELRRDAVAHAIDAANQRRKAGEKTQALAMLQQAFAAARDLDQVKSLAAQLRELKVKVDLPRHFGFLMHWHAIGPFDNTGRKGYATVYAPEQGIDLKATYPGKHGPVSWVEHTSTDDYGMIDFHKILREEKSVVAYATTEFMSAARQEVQFRLTSYNALKLWVNGRLVDEHCVYHGGSQFDQYFSHAVLQPGKNVILVKVCQNEQTEPWTNVWNFQLRVCDERGTAILSESGALGNRLQGTGDRDAACGLAHAPAAGQHCWAPVRLTALHSAPANEWRQYHGAGGASVSPATGLPITFAEGRNLAWKVPLPGRGPSSPIVVDGRVLVTSATGVLQDRLHLLCFDATDGRLLWQRQLWATGSTICHPFGGTAMATPVSDGTHVVAFYSSNDLACFDLNGNLQWYRGLGYENPTTRIDTGMASSPLIVDGAVVVQAENQGESFAAAIALELGADRWRLERDREATWVSPMLLPGKTAGQDLVLLQSKFRLTAHETGTGKQAWCYEAPCHTVATGTVSGDNIYLPAGDGLSLLRVDPAAHSVRLAWQEQRLQVGNASPIVHQGKVYAIKGAGVLVCGDAATGNVLWQLRLKGPFWASPVLADGRLYAVNYDGLVQVVELGSRGKVVGTSQIDKEILASPAVADGAIFFRSNASLWKVKLNGP